MTRKQRYIMNTSVRYLVLLAVGLVMVYPMLWMVGASFKADNNEIFSSIGIIPRKFSLQAYIDGWHSTEYTFLTYLFNTYKIVLPKVLGTVISATITAYGFARFQFKGKKLFYAILLSTLFLPQVVLNIPQYLLFREMGWLTPALSYFPLVIPAFFASDTYFVFMLVQFLRGIPRELEEAAKIDGCNTLQTLWYIICPVLKPSIVSAALFQFMWSSNDFMGPLIYVKTVAKYPASLGLRLSMDAEVGFEWNKVLAMSIVTIIPSLIVFFAAQKQFVEGVTAGSVKG
ncbi:ABC transporter permease subunit [Anaerocolumna sedimenticola]|uniref:ABC transporter permease subunit n=1 Tax=Anaerocolumna sedimenticola TaxID=2696063 RepID=A0A6P1TLT5_9FIRM|nr:carbohydrate ABC transporter permease [Anaerocolumna sedimenticola]QHQ62180.1 ABC transporter permease subunit [Anaerocolumna sedimenticola]